MKRILTMLLTIMVLFVAVACGKNDDLENTDNVNKNTTADSTKEPAKDTGKEEDKNTTEATTDNTEAEYTPLEDGDWYFVCEDDGYGYHLIHIISFADMGYDFGTAEAASESDALEDGIISYDGIKYRITDAGGEGYLIEYADNGDTVDVIISGDCKMKLSRISDNKLEIIEVDEESGFEIGTVYER